MRLYCLEAGGLAEVCRAYDFRIDKVLRASGLSLRQYNSIIDKSIQPSSGGIRAFKIEKFAELQCRERLILGYQAEGNLLFAVKAVLFRYGLNETDNFGLYYQFAYGHNYAVISFLGNGCRFSIGKQVFIYDIVAGTFLLHQE